MLQADWLATILETSPCEIYIVDCASLDVIELNQAARGNLQLRPDAPVSLRLPDLSGLDVDQTRALLRGCDAAGPDGRGMTIDHETVHQRADGSSYPVALRIRRCAAHDKGTSNPAGAARAAGIGPVYIVTGQDLTARRNAERALQLSESRFRAIVSNTPGLVYQFVLHADGRNAFA
jgi:two-component system sensor histidine kinase UhpB